MAIGQHEAIAVGPDRILRVEAYDPVPDRVDERCQRHRRARMARLRLLDRVDGQGTDRVDRQLIELFLGHATRLPFLTVMTWPASRCDRQTRSAWLRAACRRSPPRRAS